MDCAKLLSQTIDLSEAINQTAYRLPNTNKILFNYNVFKMYAKEHGANILLADATMIVSTVIFERIFSMFNYNEILSVFLVYLVPYFVFSV
jgi:hypothetical protein